MNSKELYLKMIADTHDPNTIHGDLQAKNILYDAEAGRFWPIDFGNEYKKYYSSGKEHRVYLDTLFLDGKFERVMKSLPTGQHTTVSQRFEAGWERIKSMLKMED